MPIDLSTEQKRAAVSSNFKDLLTHPGWKLFETIVRENIEVVKELLLKGAGEETLEEVKRLRDKLAVHEEIINTPTNMIEKLKPSDEGDIPNDDPFEEVPKT